MQDLNRYVIKIYACDWKDIGLELGLQFNTLEIFSKNHLKECVACFQSTLYEWLSLNPNATWRMLEVAITNVWRSRNGLDPVTDLYGEYVKVSDLALYLFIRRYIMKNYILK